MPLGTRSEPNTPSNTALERTCAEAARLSRAPVTAGHSIMKQDPKLLLEHYAEDVCHPEVSGFELLDLLSTRSALAEGEASLLPAQRRLLEEADARLVAAAPVVLARLVEIAPLSELRQRVNASPSHWWWYLDLLQRTARALSSAESKEAS